MTHHHRLEAAIKQIRYAKGVSQTPGAYCAIKGQSFFPGGKGHDGETLPIEGVMYLGHNFDKLEGFRVSVARGYEENLTWRRIRDSVLPTLPSQNIWFTNYFMGVLEREATSVQSNDLRILPSMNRTAGTSSSFKSHYKDPGSSWRLARKS